jgi:hypothetical protein
LAKKRAPGGANVPVFALMSTLRGRRGAAIPRRLAQAKKAGTAQTSTAAGSNWGVQDHSGERRDRDTPGREILVAAPRSTRSQTQFWQQFIQISHDAALDRLVLSAIRASTIEDGQKHLRTGRPRLWMAKNICERGIHDCGRPKIFANGASTIVDGRKHLRIGPSLILSIGVSFF